MYSVWFLINEAGITCLTNVSFCFFGESTEFVPAAPPARLAPSSRDAEERKTEPKLLPARYERRFVKIKPAAEPSVAEKHPPVRPRGVAPCRR